jgi:methylase of polypeptide subunit release factors
MYHSSFASAERNKPKAFHQFMNIIHWQEQGLAQTAHWRSEAGRAAPARVEVVDDSLSADAAYKLVCAGTGLLWRGDFQNARQLLQALMRRCDKPADRKRRGRGVVSALAPPSMASDGMDAQGQPTPGGASGFPQAFHLHRQAQAQRARLLGLLLIPMNADGHIPLRRAPDWRRACAEAWGEFDALTNPKVNASDALSAEGLVLSLRELLGLVGAHEWHKKGVAIAALDGQHIHPAYGVFSPVRGEYIDLVARAPLPAALLAGGKAFELGVGTGVLAAVLVQRGVAQVLATDLDPRALRCAQDNLLRLGAATKVQLLQADLFPPNAGQADLIVCNPPWLPGRASSPIERAIYDENSQMLRGFLRGLKQHLRPQGEGWLILSDLAEHLGLRSRAELLAWVAAADLQVLGRMDIQPRHPKAADAKDPLHAARGQELTSLWRLGH